jgi:AraC-like DNA-binding protein/mannose-6-phosphate isomerase-like protein (cupin superfamily)
MINNNEKNTYDELVNEEVIYQNPLLSLKIWEIDLKEEEDKTGETLEQYPWHYHKEVEFLAIMEGHLAIQSKYNFNMLGPGDVFIMGASQPHRSCKPLNEKLQYIVFQVDLVKHFDPSILPYLYCFSELTHPLEQLNYIFKDREQTKQEAHDLIRNIFTEVQKQQKGYEIAINYSIKKLMLLLVRSDSQNLLNYTDNNELNRLKPVLDYVDSHLADKISVEDACSLVNLSYHYFIKYFKKMMGVSFIDYINLKRIKKAELLLLTSEMSIMEVSYEVGIFNMAQFYKLFKRHNQCSPKAFKFKMLSETGMTIEF